MRTTKKEKLATLRPFYNVHGIYDTRDIKSKAIGHFFDKGAMRFFNSRILGDVIPSTKNVYFVTSEQFDYKSPRLYTVRALNLETRKVETIGEFQGFETKAQAVSFAIDCAFNDVQGV